MNLDNHPYILASEYKKMACPMNVGQRAAVEDQGYGMAHRCVGPTCAAWRYKKLKATGPDKQSGYNFDFGICGLVGA